MAKKVAQKPKTASKTQQKRNPAFYAQQFKKGQSGNPKGGQLHNPAVKAIRRMTTERLAEIIESLMDSTPKELFAKWKDPNTPVMEGIIIRAMLDDQKNGGWYRLNDILSRVIGKVPENVNLRSPDGSMSPVQPQNLKNLSTEDLEQIKAIHGKLNPASVAPSGGEGTGET